MVKYHTDSERGNPLSPHGLLFPINSKRFFYMHHSTDKIAHTTAFVTPVVEHWLEREITQWVHPMNDRSDNPSTMSERSALSSSTYVGPFMEVLGGMKYRPVAPRHDTTSQIIWLGRCITLAGTHYLSQRLPSGHLICGEVQHAA